MSLDSDLDRLYQLPPAEFIGERNALAKRAGARGAEIRALPKPTLPVWVVNQLHWREPDVYRTLVESAENLRATHRAVLGGKRGDLRAASRAHEQALDAALKAALRIAAAGGTPASDAARQTIATTLRALPAADPPGRLRQALTPGGFEALGALTSGRRAPSGSEAWQAVGVPPSPGLRRASPKPSGGGGPHGKPGKVVIPTAKSPGPKASKAAEPEKKIDRAALERANKAAEAAGRALASAEQAARREEFEAARAGREAEKADRRVARAKEALASAQAELEEAEREAAGAATARDAAQVRSEAADRALETAREAADAARTAVAQAKGQA